MIHPIRAIGFAVGGFGCGWVPAACCDSLTLPRWIRIAAWRCDFPYSGALGSIAGRSRLYRPVRECDRLTQPLADRLAAHAVCRRTEEWHPWPVVPPFVDRVDHWWPGDAWPLVKPLPPAESHPTPPPPQILSWRDIGGLLDTWA